jgi:hypothetical protein
MSEPKFVAETPQDRERRLAENQEQPVDVMTQPIDITSYINVYEFDTTLPGSGQVVTFKPVTTGQMKKMLAYEQADDPQEIEAALDMLISECVVSPDFDINKLYLQDRFFLLLEIRSKTKGNKYEFHWQCPICELDQPASALISEMNVVPIQETHTELQLNDVLSADFTFPDRGMQVKAAKLVSDQKDLSDTEKMFEMGLYVYAQCMTTFNTPAGKVQPSIEDKYTVLNGVSSDSFGAIQKWLEEYDFGVEFLQEVGCASPTCEFSHTMEIPYTNFFD